MAAVCLFRRASAHLLGGRGSGRGKRAFSAQAMAGKSFYDFSAQGLGGGTRDNPTEGAPIPFNQFEGKVVLIQNVATLNALNEKYDNLAVLGFPCNQFGHQTQEKEFEILNLLKYVRPGNGFEPNFPLTAKCDCNGEDEHEVFTFLKEALPFPSDDCGGGGADLLAADVRKLIWAPIKRGDLTWNFEKFLINQNGVPVKRYSPKFQTESCAADIERLINDGPDALF